MKSAVAVEKFVHFDVPDGRVIVSIRVYEDDKFLFRRLKSFPLTQPIVDICDEIRGLYDLDVIGYQILMDIDL